MTDAKQPYQPSVDNWRELRDRLERAAAALYVPLTEPRDYNNARLRGKSQGVRLALSYMDDAERPLATP